MKEALAEKILMELMGWTSEIVTTEQFRLHNLANLKYNEYQIFRPGIRFIESLTQWLDQFELKERIIAYEYIISNLIFISNLEISQLISLVYQDYIRNNIVRKTSNELKINPIKIQEIINSQSYKKLLRQSLFVGLSDGSKIDQFRRYNYEFINHEQVYLTYQIKDKIEENMIAKLKSDLSRDFNSNSEDEAKFKLVFLLDDFTGSGKSFIRKEDGKFEGKICKFLNSIFKEIKLDKKSPELYDNETLEIHIIFYIATVSSINYLKKEINKWLQLNNLDNKFSVDAIQLINDKELKNNILNNQEFQNILKKYFDDSIINESFRKGKYKYPYLGFDECGIPLIISHNTPNNSIPLLWFEDERKYRGLFPRINRHKK